MLALSGATEQRVAVVVGQRKHASDGSWDGGLNGPLLCEFLLKVLETQITVLCLEIAIRVGYPLGGFGCTIQVPCEPSNGLTPSCGTHITNLLNIGSSEENTP